jgi:hypothetical protein
MNFPSSNNCRSQPRLCIYKAYKTRLVLASLLFAAASAAVAAPEEIQVYLDEFAEPGKFGLDFHTNYVLSAQPLAVSRRQLRVTPELSYGINQHWEAALYWLTAAGPAVSGGQPVTDGAKVRLKWRPRAPSTDSPWYGAVNLEVGKLSQRFYSEGTSAEVKFIGMYSRGPWVLGVNLNIDRSLRRPTRSAATYEVDTKVSYRLKPESEGDLRIGVENYAYMDAIRPQAMPLGRSNTSFLVADFSLNSWDFNVGLGKVSGVTLDHWLVKAIIGVPFN